MKVIVFGATGGTGRELCAQALAAGHDVTAYARDPSKLDDLQHEPLRVIAGDVLDPDGVEKAVEGQEAVLSAIGAGAGRSTVREVGTRTIVEAMEKTGVRRLISLSSMGVGDSRASLDFFTRYVVVGIFLRHAFADHERQEALLRESSLDWMIVRPPHLIDGPRTGTYQHALVGNLPPLRGKLSRADLADFMLKQLEDDTYLRRAPVVSY